MHFAFSYYLNYWQMKLICNLSLLVSFTCKGLDRTNWKSSANNSQLRSKKVYLRYLSLGNLEAIFLYHALNPKSLVDSSLLKLFYTFIVALFTYFSKFLLALYVSQLFAINVWQRIFFLDRVSFRTLF